MKATKAIGEHIESLEESFKPDNNKPRPSPLTCRECKTVTNVVCNIGIYQHEINGTLQRWKTGSFICDKCDDEIKHKLRLRAFKEFGALELEKLTEGIPMIYKESTLEDFGQIVIDKCEAWFNDKTKWSMFLHGDWGTGKTFLAWALLKRYFQNEMNSKGNFKTWCRNADNYTYIQREFDKPIFFNMATMATVLRKEVIDGGETLSKVCECKSIVIIDDLGKEKLTEFLTQQLYLICNERYSNGLKTVITSNNSIPEMIDKNDGAIVSRLSAGEVIELNGNDRRMK